MKDRIVYVSVLIGVVSALLSTVEVLLFTQPTVYDHMTMWVSIATGYSPSMAKSVVVLIISMVVFLLSGALSLVTMLWVYWDTRHRLATLADVSAMYLAGRVGTESALKGHDDLARTAANMYKLASQVQNQAVLLQKDTVQKATENERARFSRELHDRVSQDLFGLSLMSHALFMHSKKMTSDGDEQLAELDALITKVQRNLRSILLELRPVELQERTLEEALRQLSQELSGRLFVDVTVQISPSQQDGTQESVDQVLFLIAQQALINAMRHAKATSISVRLDREMERTVLSVIDNGIGLDEGKVGVTSVGFVSMRERAMEVGGHCLWQTPARGGTEVLVIIPRMRQKNVDDIGVTEDDSNPTCG